MLMSTFQFISTNNLTIDGGVGGVVLKGNHRLIDIDYRLTETPVNQITLKNITFTSVDTDYDNWRNTPAIRAFEDEFKPNNTRVLTIVSENVVFDSVGIGIRLLRQNLIIENTGFLVFSNTTLGIQARSVVIGDNALFKKNQGILWGKTSSSSKGWCICARTSLR